MTRIFVGGVVGGGALFVVGLAWALGTGSSDPGTRAAPTALGVAILVATVGATVAVSFIGIAVWFAPVVRAARQIRSSGTEAWVVQRSTGLQSALESIEGRMLDVPSYLLLSAQPSGIVLSTAEGVIAHIPAGWVDDIDTAATMTSRRVPSVVIHVTTAAGVVASPEVVPSRSGYELFPVLDVTETAAIAEQWKAVLGVPRPDRDDI